MLKKAFLLALVFSCLATNAAPQEATVPPAKPLAERLAPDDGAAAAILFGANMRGNLDLCDCNHPRGGLARRVGFVQEYKKLFPKTTVIQVEAGFFWYNNETLSPVTQTQNDYVTRAYSRWQMDAINLGRYDLFYANRLLAKTGIEEKRASLPMIKSLISANGFFEAGVAPPPPYLVKDFTGPRISLARGARKRLRVGFLGVAEPIRPGAGMRDAMVKNMFEMARKYVPELRKKCDVLVILAHSESEAAMKLATENPEADLIIVGNAEGLFRPRQVGKTTIVFAAPGNIQEGELRLYLTPNGKVSFKFQAHDLDAGVPADAEALKFADEARQAISNVRHR